MSLREVRTDVRSEVEAWRLWRDERIWDVGVGRARTREVKSASRSSMNSGSGRAESGETRECVKVKSVRV